MVILIHCRFFVLQFVLAKYSHLVENTYQQLYIIRMRGNQIARVQNENHNARPHCTAFRLAYQQFHQHSDQVLLSTRYVRNARNPTDRFWCLANALKWR